LAVVIRRIFALTALIITDNQESFRYYDRALRQENIYAKHSFFNPHEVFNKLLAVQPDILLMEVGLGDRAAWLLDYLSQLHLPRRPAIFICMGQRTSSWEQLFLRKGAMYVFDKSMSEMNIADCMLNLHSLYRNLEREENLYPSWCACCGIAAFLPSTVAMIALWNAYRCSFGRRIPIRLSPKKYIHTSQKPNLPHP
jgi:DNA-binding NarL/FixJ family response regulator